MPKIQVNLIDMAGNITSLPLPDNKPLYTLIPPIIVLLDLFETDAAGNQLTYRLFSRQLQSVLDPEITLAYSGVPTNDFLRLVPILEEVALELELISEPSPGTRIPLFSKERITIGRGSENDIIIRDSSISRQHGELVWQNGIHIFRDLNSSNGSYVNNQAVSEPTPLALGSILLLGETIRLRYQASQDVSLSALSQHATDHAESMVIDSQTRTRLAPLPHGSVFITYHKAQLDAVRELVEELRAANFHVYWDQETPAGSNVGEVVDKALHLADVLLVILSPNSTTQLELIEHCNEFLLSRKPIVTLLFEECEIPKVIRNFPLVRNTGDFARVMDDVINKLIDAIG